MSISPRARFDRSFPLAVTAGVLGLVALGAAVLAGPAHSGTNELRDIRIGSHAPQTHVVIEADAPFCAAISLTEMPYRLSVDLPDLGGARPSPRAFGVVAGTRWSDQAPSRLQFDLKQPARVVESLVVPPADGKGFRRVIKLEAVDARGFAQARHQWTLDGDGCARAPATTAARAAPAATAVTASLLPPPVPQPPTTVVLPPPAAAGSPFAAIPSANAAPVADKPAYKPAAGPIPVAAPSPAAAPPAVPPPSVAAPVAAAPVVAAPVVAVRPAAPPPAAAAKPQTAAVPVPTQPSSRVPKDRKWTVVIDPGHGGEDPGALSTNGDYEKDITLAMARVLRAKMEATKRYRVHLTRDSDEFIELRERTAVAKRLDAHLFISLHADSISSRLVRGLSVYTLSDKGSDAESDALAAKENRADLIVGKDHSRDETLNTILWRLDFDSVSKISIQYRKLIVEEMGKGGVEILPSPRRSAGFVVLKAHDVPSVLVEMGYLSNAADAKLMRNAAYQNRFTQAVIKAADRFFACPEVVKWFAGNENESLVAQGHSCAPSSLAMGAQDGVDSRD